MNKKITAMKKLGWFLDKLLRVFEVLLYSLVLPFALFMALVLGEMAEKIYATVDKNSYGIAIFWVVSIEPPG